MAVATTVEYDSETGVYRGTFETQRPSPSLALVEAVAAIEGTDPTAMEPVGNVVDMSAIDAIIQATDEGRDTRITVPYLGYHATISTDGIVEVRPAEPSTPRTAD